MDGSPNGGIALTTVPAAPFLDPQIALAELEATRFVATWPRTASAA
jgi:hypothetical protein